MEQIREYKIYKLYCETTNLIYIGHTKNSLAKRLRDHKASRTSTSQYLSDPQIELLEIIKTTKEDCLLCEKYYINLFNEKYPAMVVNHNQPLRDSLEWYYDNRQRILQHKKNLYNLDKQKYINRCTLRYHKNCYIKELNKDIHNSSKLKRHREKIENLSNIFH